MELGNAFEDESTKDDWEAIRVQLDEVALTASGDVKTRLAELVEEWPSYADVIIHDGMTTVNDLLHSVGRACKAGGSEVEYNYLVTG